MAVLVTDFSWDSLELSYMIIAVNTSSSMRSFILYTVPITDNKQFYRCSPILCRIAALYLGFVVRLKVRDFKNCCLDT
jgi:hypothetical protein